MGKSGLSSSQHNQERGSHKAHYTGKRIAKISLLPTGEERGVDCAIFRLLLKF